MRYTEMDIIKEYNAELVKLINDGWILIPHSYSNGVYHENFVKGNVSKVLEIVDTHSDYNDENPGMRYRYRKVIQICTSKFDYKYPYDHWLNSWDFKKKDCTTEIIHRFYKISDLSKCNAYIDSYEDAKAIGDIQSKRRNLNWVCHNYKSITLPKNEIALRFMKKQYKCKTIKMNDISKVEKRIYNSGQVEYLVYAKGKSYGMH